MVDRMEGDSHIENINSYQTIRSNYKEFGFYANATRTLASGVDGMKSVYRRMLYTSLQYPEGKYVKSAVIAGECMKLHPHGEQAGVLYSLVNSRLALYDKQGNFGSALIEGSAPRYTECRPSKNAYYYLGQDLVNYAEMIEGEIGYKEPKYLPALIPFILVEGNNAMGIGVSTSLGQHNALDLLDFYRAYLKNPHEGKKYHEVKLDVGRVYVRGSKKEVSKGVTSGVVKGFRFSPIGTIEGNSIVVTSVPPGMARKKIMSVFNDAIEKELVDYRDESNAELRLVFDIVHGDPYEYLAKLEGLTSTESYDLVVTGSGDEEGSIVYTDLYSMRRETMKYLKECAHRKFSTEKSKLVMKKGVLEVIAYLKTSGMLKDLPTMTTDEVIEKVPFEKEFVKQALAQSISRLMKGTTQEEIDDLTVHIAEADKNLSDPNPYLIKLYDDFEIELKKVYKSETVYSDDAEKIKSSEGSGEYFLASDGKGWMDLVYDGDLQNYPNEPYIQIVPLDPKKYYLALESENRGVAFKGSDIQPKCKGDRIMTTRVGVKDIIEVPYEEASKYLFEGKSKKPFDLGKSYKIGGGQVK
jgi:topoisomerase-4 subunit A